MTITQIPLDDGAVKCRTELEAWIQQAKQAQDYIIDAKGNRKYFNQSIKPYVTAMLENMGIPVCRKICDYQRATDIFLRTGASPCGVSQQLNTSIGYIRRYIRFLSGQCRGIHHTEQTDVLLGNYTVTHGDFHLTPELDCLFVGERPKNEGFHAI
jgi:hypothetical protein